MVNPFNIDFIIDNMLNHPKLYYRKLCYKMLHKGYSRLVHPKYTYLQNDNLKNIIINFKNKSRRTLVEFFP
jgi:hypothetical protein